MATATIDASAFPADAVWRACYWIADRAVTQVETVGNNISVTISEKEGGPEIERLVEVFRNSLVDFAVRVSVEARTADLRNRIWAAAFGQAAGGRS